MSLYSSTRTGQGLPGDSSRKQNTESYKMDEIITPPLKMLRLPQVLDRTGLSRSSIFNLIKKGVFPRQIQLAPRTVAWNQSDINDWLVSRIRESRLKKAA